LYKLNILIANFLLFSSAMLLISSFSIQNKIRNEK
jgi:hypothetical protein